MPAHSGSVQAGPVQSRSATGRYTYRAKAPRSQSTANKEHAKLTDALAAHRQLLTHASSAIRTLTSARNEMIAQAVADGLTLATISAVTRENLRSVRTIALAYDELHPSGFSRSAHLEALKAKSEELLGAERHRDQILERREALILMAFRTKACDDIELASLTGLTPDHIRRTTRKVRQAG
ncbi:MULTISPECIES: hypothetical protein [Arthrobacter]|uniref:hypothetical protein n=1 Tax=Arthrobacter TaxID=1663 RepID=UPI001F369506|nr:MULTISPECIES: hypothetical protein [Arthrobacter]